VELKNFDKMGKFYITTSIAYVNALPHIGYALELAQADGSGLEETMFSF